MVGTLMKHVRNFQSDNYANWLGGAEIYTSIWSKREEEDINFETGSSIVIVIVSALKEICWK